MTSSSSSISVEPTPAITLRAGQANLFRLVDQYRMLAFVARRQYGKPPPSPTSPLKR